MIEANDTLDTSPGSDQAGFTLIEALVAIVILIFGLMAVTNLFLVAGSSNTVGNHGTVATAIASEVMDRLNAIEYRALTDAGGGGDLTVGNDGLCEEPAANCVVPGTFEMTRDMPGVGRFITTWQITAVPETGAGPLAVVNSPAGLEICPAVAGGNQAYSIVVHTESISPLARRRAAAQLTTIRSCTIDGCPGIRSCS